MNDDGSRKVRVVVVITTVVAVLKIEAFGELEIELERSTLVVAAEGVSDEDVDLGAIECAVLRVD